MTNIMVMIVVNIHEVKAKLSEYLGAVARGERVLICNRNRPVAELRPVAGQRTTPRPIGGAKGTFTVPSSFFDGLPEDMLDAFSGLSGSSASVPSGSSSRAAEVAPGYHKKGSARRKVRK